jgi:hypothetical protein
MGKGVYMNIVLTRSELIMIYDALEFYMVENDSRYADIIIDIQDKIEEVIEKEII